MNSELKKEIERNLEISVNISKRFRDPKEPEWNRGYGTAYAEISIALKELLNKLKEQP